jgi:DNA-binding IclR family transcriptional regulator
VRLGYSAIYSDPLLRTALPYLHYLAEQVGEAAFLAERLGYHAAPVPQVLPRSLRKELGWYTRERLHSTSTGKILLAYAEEHDLQRVLGNGLAMVHEAGFATSFEEQRPGINAVAVPLREPRGSVVAAIAVAGRAYSLTREKDAASLEQLKAIAADITSELTSAP